MKKYAYMKKILALALGSAMVLSAVGCGSGQGTQNAGGGEAQAPAEQETKADAPAAADGAAEQEAGGEKVVIKMTWWGGQTRHDQTQAVCDLYTSQHPDVTFELSPSGWDGYFDKLSTQTASGSMPDIVQMDYLYLATYAKNTFWAGMKIHCFLQIQWESRLCQL